MARPPGESAPLWAREHQSRSSAPWEVSLGGECRGVFRRERPIRKAALRNSRAPRTAQNMRSARCVFSHDPPHATPSEITQRLVTRAESGITEGSSLIRLPDAGNSESRVSRPNETLGRPASHTATVPSPTAPQRRPYASRSCPTVLPTPRPRSVRNEESATIRREMVRSPVVRARTRCPANSMTAPFS
jgi:hypothetical protein